MTTTPSPLPSFALQSRSFSPQIFFSSRGSLPRLILTRGIDSPRPFYPKSTLSHVIAPHNTLDLHIDLPFFQLPGGELSQIRLFLIQNPLQTLRIVAAPLPFASADMTEAKKYGQKRFLVTGIEPGSQILKSRLLPTCTTRSENHEIAV